MASTSNLRTMDDLCIEYRHLVWSHPEAADGLDVTAALRRANFYQLLDFAVMLGSDRRRSVWDMIRTRELAIGLSGGSALSERSLGIHINLWWGLVQLVCGGLLLFHD